MSPKGQKMKNEIGKKYEFAYIYGLIDPIINQIKYVGWTINIKRRFAQHILLCNLKKNTHKNNWIKKLLSLNLKPSIIILEEVSYDLWNQKEKEWIKFFGRDNLTNSTDGGEGVENLPEETLRRRSELNRGENNPRYGVRASDETRQKMSDSHKGIPPCNKAFELSKKSHIRDWFGLVSPEGIVYEKITDLPKFCKDMCLKYGCIRRLFTGERFSHKGWTIYGNEFNRKPRSDIGKQHPYVALAQSRIWPGILISPEGEVFENIFNMRNFCRDKNINYSGIKRLFSGILFEYKGWKLLLENKGEI
jgi:hypothetical protein